MIIENAPLGTIRGGAVVSVGAAVLAYALIVLHPTGAVPGAAQAVQPPVATNAHAR